MPTCNHITGHEELEQGEHGFQASLRLHSKILSQNTTGGAVAGVFRSCLSPLPHIIFYSNSLEHGHATTIYEASLKT